MLLTIPWFLSIVWGRVNIDVNSRTPRYRHPKLDPPAYLSLSETGVSVTAAVRNGSIIMLLTSLTYLLLQIPGASLSGMSRREQIDGERNWALVGSFLCVILFVAYLGYQYQLSKKG